MSEQISKYLVQTNLALQKHESKRPRHGEELSLELALSEKNIIHDDIERLKQVLRLVMVKIGLRSSNWPEDEEKKILIAHIIENYGGHTASELKLAFEMAIAGKLEDAEGKTVSATCYENFSCHYFSLIMNAYRSWARQVAPTLPMKQEEKKPDIPVINLLYAGYLQNKINKLPCRKFSRLRSIKK